MGRPITVQATLILTLLAALILPPAASPVQAATVDVHAHRGGAGLAPENTLAAFRNALALDVDVLELVRGSGNSRVRFNIETKYEPAVPAPPQDFEERALRVIREAGMIDRVIIQSFYYPSQSSGRRRPISTRRASASSTAPP